MAVPNISFTIFNTVSNCPVYTPMIKRLKPNSNKREPMTLCSGGSMIQSLFDGLMIRRLINQVDLPFKHLDILWSFLSFNKGVRVRDPLYKGEGGL